MIVDGVDLATIGLIVQNRGRSRGTPRVRQTTESSPFAYKAVLLGREGARAKAITLRGALNAATVAALRTAMDNLNWALRPQVEHTLEWSDDATREWLVEFEEIAYRDFPRAPGWITPAVLVDVNVIAVDPRARSPSELTIVETGALPLVAEFPAIGNAPFPVILEITGNNGTPIDAPVIEYRDKADVVLRTLEFDLALDGTDQLIVDTGTGVVELNGSNAIDDLTADSDSPVFEVDPDDGDFPGAGVGDRPDLRLSASSGISDDFTVRYRLRWWN